MIRQPLRKAGDHYVVTIPVDEVARLRITDGQLLGIEITPFVDGRPTLRPELEEALEESWEGDEVAYRYLSDR